jgi:Arc/MetJ-type ribon-helix-helix transcriptional regulator
MRDVINISLPKELSKELEKMVKRGKYSTKSEFLRNLIREKLEEEDLWKSVQRSEVEFKAGKGKILKSLADLR